MVGLEDEGVAIVYSSMIVANEGPVVGDAAICRPARRTEVVEPSKSTHRPWRHAKGNSRVVAVCVEGMISLVSLTSNEVFDSKPLLVILIDA